MELFQVLTWEFFYSESQSSTLPFPKSNWLESNMACVVSRFVFETAGFATPQQSEGVA
jgi:hypothetical protein